ncbi:MAG: hypothetical protein HY778_04420 [Betaproteobacteria bacterium]|nr:hypothetical protein [Betaproteobacteria bacterium]
MPAYQLYTRSGGDVYYHGATLELEQAKAAARTHVRYTEADIETGAILGPDTAYVKEIGQHGAVFFIAREGYQGRRSVAEQTVQP